MTKLFFKNVVFLFAVELVVRLKAVVLIPLLTHHLGAAEYGLWSQVAVLVAMLSPLVTLGTDSAITRYLPGTVDREARARYSGWMMFVMFTTFGCALLLHVTREQVAAAFFGNTSGLATFVSLAAVSLVGMIANNALRLWYRISNRSRAFGTVAAVQSIIGLTAVVAAVFNGADPFQIISWPIYGDLLLALLLALRLRSEHVWAMPSWEGFRQMVAFGLVVLPAGFAVWGLNYIDRIFLVQYTSLAEVGVYALTFSLASIMIQFAVGPIWSMYFTSAAELHNKGRSVELQRLFDRSIDAICLVTAPLIAITAFYGTDILSMLSTSSYLSGAPIMPVIAFGYVLMIFSSYFETSLALHDKARIGTVAAVAAVAVKVLLNMVLIAPWGIYGAAASSIAAFAIQLGITCSICLSKRYIHFSPRYGALAYIYAFVGFSLPWAVTTQLAPNYGWPLAAVSAGIGSLLYLLAVLRAGGLHPEVVRWIHAGNWKKRLNSKGERIFNWLIKMK